MSSQVPSSSASVISTEIQSDPLKHVNDSVQLLLKKFSKENRYTNPAYIQEALLKNYPAVCQVFNDKQLNQNDIPRLAKHAKLIKQINDRICVYSTVNNIVTLIDIKEIICKEAPNDYHLLGPITKLPVILNIFRVNKFHRRIEQYFESNQFCVQLEKLSSVFILREFKRCMLKHRYDSTKYVNSKFAKSILVMFKGALRSAKDLQNPESLYQFGIKIKSYEEVYSNMIITLNITDSYTNALNCLQRRLGFGWDNIVRNLRKNTPLGSCSQRNPERILKCLGVYSLILYKELNDISKKINIVWPVDYLKALVTFSTFMNTVVSKKPFNRLLCSLILLSDTTSLEIETLVKQLILPVITTSSNVVIDLTDIPNDQTTEVLEKVNHVLNQHIRNGIHSDNLWLTLASLEKELLHTSLNQNSEISLTSLLSYLVEAVNQNHFIHTSNSSELNFSSENTKEIEEITNSLQSVSSREHFDLHKVFQFLQKLTCLSLRDNEEVSKLICAHLNIQRSVKLDQFLIFILPKVIHTENELYALKALIYHDCIRIRDKSVSEMAQHRCMDYQSSDNVISRLLTHRECVLRLLSLCPSLMDLEVWCQWHLTNWFYDRWGNLESFLKECDTDQVCNRFNLTAIRLLSSGGTTGPSGSLIRLTAHPTSDDFMTAYKQWQSRSNHHYAFRLLCDYMIGAAINVSQFSVLQMCPLLASLLSDITGILFKKFLSVNHFSEDKDFISFMYFENFLFSNFQIIIPSIQLANKRNSKSWPLDIADIMLAKSSYLHSLLDILFSDILISLRRDTKIEQSNNGIDLISAVGSIGYQLKWPAYIKCFEEKRFKVTDIENVTSDICRSSSIGDVYSPSCLPKFGLSNVDVKNHFNFEEVAFKKSIINTNNLTITDVATTTITNTITKQQFVEELRCREFGVGVKLNEEAENLLQRIEGKLSRSLIQLSTGLYGLPGHFLLELIQNADDNVYADNVLPSLEFHLTNFKVDNITSDNVTLLVMNNEAVGFTLSDISALCDVGQSTKVTQRDLKIGRKGIGFKSVFNITDTPEIHSNGFHVRFQRQRTNSQFNSHNSLMLILEWCQEFHRSQINIDIPSWCRTLFLLPLSDRLCSNSIFHSSSSLRLIQLIQSTLKANLLLFLRHLRCLTFSSIDVSLLFVIPGSIYISLFYQYNCYAELISIHETELSDAINKQQKTTIHKWFSFKQSIPVDFNDSLKILPKETEISIAVSLTDPEPLQTCPIYAFLPVLGIGLRFSLNADFDLTSSREDVDSNSLWNRWLVDKIPVVFINMIRSIEKVCFANKRLSNLLMNSLQLYEPHPELFSQYNFVESSEDKREKDERDGTILFKQWKNNSVVDCIKMEVLNWLGAQSISVLSLLNLTAVLKPDDLAQPGLLSAIMSMMESCLSNQTKSFSVWKSQSHVSISVNISRCHLVNRLQNLPIFPLTNGNCVRILDKQKQIWATDQPPGLTILLPPHPSEIVSILIDITYDDYIQLIGKFGPLIRPDLMHYDYQNVKYSSLLVNKSPLGLGLQIAYPHIVLKEWILPYLQFDVKLNNASSKELIVWLISVGQFYASVNVDFNASIVSSLSSSSSSSSEYHSEFSTMLPLVVSQNLTDDDITLPALYIENGMRRNEVVLIPPNIFTLSPSSTSSTKLEVDLFNCLTDKHIINNAQKSFYIVSSKYFVGSFSSNNSRQQYRWLKLFSGAGASTLLSVHNVKYLYQTASVQLSENQFLSINKDILPLPAHHPLSTCMNEYLVNNLNDNGGRSAWLVDDYISPGIEVLLEYISSTKSNQVGVKMGEYLCCLLNDNWSIQINSIQSTNHQNHSKSSISSLYFYNPTGNHIISHLLTYSSWFSKLRQITWLPVRSSLSNTSFKLMSPIDSQMIYSPLAFINLQLQNPDFTQLLKENCYLWNSSLHSVDNPLNIQFTTSIGLINDVNCKTFEHLMRQLGEKAKRDPTVPLHLTPDLMMFIYRLSVKYYLRDHHYHGKELIDNFNINRSLTDWLRTVFANPTYPCILVQCSATVTHKSMCIRQHQEYQTPSQSSNNSLDCPVCKSVKINNQNVKSSRKRLASSSIDHVPFTTKQNNKSVYHLVGIDMVCWSSIVSDVILNGKSSLTDVDNEDIENNAFSDDLCLLSEFVQTTEENHLPMETVQRSRKFVLSQCYSPKSRQFFVEKLGLPSTSSIDEILSLRPCLPYSKFRDNEHSHYRQFLEYGRKLAHWYALLDYCVREEYFRELRGDQNLQIVKSSVMAHLKQSPIILDSSGQWHRPCDLVNRIRSNEPKKSCLFTWHKPVFGRMIHHICRNNNSHLCYKVMAYSLSLLNKVYKPKDDLFTSSTTSSCDMDALSTMIQFTSSVKQQQHAGGKAHHLLLDLFDLP
ncbi:hypothetical protein MN116_004600, partial [Schistosoma mekongi]